MPFHQPLWLFLLLVLPFLALLRVSTGKGGKSLVSQRLRGELIVGASQGLRWAVFCLNLAALGLLTVALARPQWGFHETDTVSEGRNLIVAIDTSRSMLATDLQPDRMTRAKLAAQDIVQSLPEDRIGLIAFAGKAFLQAPLTVDHEAVLESISQLDTEIIPRGGTNIEAPVELALETFTEAESKESALIIFSDGEDLEGEKQIENLREKASELGMIIVAVGVGTEKGSIIPEPDLRGRPQTGIFIKDDTGNVVRSRLNPEALQKMSAESGVGVYINLGGTSSITSLIGKAIDSLSATRLEDQARRVPIERFMWPLSAAVFLWVIAFLLPASSRAFVKKQAKQFQLGDSPPPAPLPVRGRSITGWITAALLPATIGFADGNEKTSLGYEALKDKKYEEAITAYEVELSIEESTKKRNWLNLGLGSAAYLEGDYEKAQQKFGQVLAEAESIADIEQAHFNIGNTSFRKGQIAMGWNQQQKRSGSAPEIPRQIADKTTRKDARVQWENARDHYEAALDLNPENNKARQNADLMGRYLTYLEQIEQQEKKKEEEQKQEEEEQEKEEEEEKDDQQDQEEGENEDEEKDGQSKDEPKDGEPSDEEKDSEKKEPKDDKPGDKDANDDGEKKPSEGERDEKDSKDGKPEDKSEDEGQGDEKPFEPDPKSQPPEPRDPNGDLKANPHQPNKQKPMTPQQAQQAAERAKNPETGYSPSEARKLLRELSDETLEVKPIYAPMKAEKYRNW